MTDMQKYEIALQGNGKELISFTGEFQRINIILGGNGTGKSKLLLQLKGQVNSFGDPRPLIYVEGGRTVQIPTHILLTQQNFNNYRTFQQTENGYKNKRQSNLSQRINDALILLDQTEQEINNKYANEAHNWDKNGRKTPFPKKPQPPLERLFELFNEVFPSIELEFDSLNNKTLYCHKNGNKYTPNNLSDGEKQIFCLLADIVILADSNSFILVDEPELNLNPGLACRFWDIVENELPDAIFIYATHCVSFAMRRNVETIYVLSNNPDNITKIEDISELDSFQLNSLLGAIPAILSSSLALAVEGEESSFDQTFYKWLLSNNDLEVIPVGGCSDVNSVSNKRGIWDKIAPNVKIGGIIDSDYRSDEELSNFSNSATTILKYHEVESYLCTPKLIHDVGNALSVVENVPTEEEVRQLIINAFQSQKNAIAAQRTFARAKIRLGVSVHKKALSQITSEEKLKEIVSKEAEKEEKKASDSIGKERIIKILDEELNRCKSAIESSSIDDILKLMPGKALINQLSPKIGCRTERNLLNAVKKHIQAGDFPHLVALKNEINKLIE